jgi:hypothetical protein
MKKETFFSLHYGDLGAPTSCKKVLFGRRKNYLRDFLKGSWSEGYECIAIMEKLWIFVKALIVVRSLEYMTL